MIRAAGGVVLRLRGGRLEVLLVGGTPGEPDYWGFPKGKQENGEPIELTALREIREETGFGAELLALVGINRYPVRSRGGALEQKEVLLFLARSTGGDLARRDEERIDARWVEMGEALRLIKYEEDRAALRLAGRLVEQIALYRALLAEE